MLHQPIGLQTWGPSIGPQLLHQPIGLQTWGPSVGPQLLHQPIGLQTWGPSVGPQLLHQPIGLQTWGPSVGPQLLHQPIRLQTCRDPSDAEVLNKDWYVSSCDRQKAEDALTATSKDGSFLVRKSSRQDSSHPFTLVVFYKRRVYNIPVRYIEATRQYALGSEKSGEEVISDLPVQTLGTPNDQLLLAQAHPYPTGPSQKISI
ncbi:unnamed protein product [Ranitomeya imitator]|uniref:SH2 domain-containing protein n=1 Tax=Ranitomeya imitator TaxID=111125 RepID=A0ABN9KYD7_9NEOB|nr:unnamed protein product [Ranitomeya imitator]